MSEWISREPVRAALLPFVVLVTAYLVGKGVLDADSRDFIVAAVTLLVGTFATEAARARVSPVDPQ